MSGSVTLTEKVWRVVLYVAATAGFVFLVAPILAIVPLSFNDGQFLTYPLRGLTLRWYENFFFSGTWMFSIRNSLIIGVCAALIASVLGTLAAIGLWLAEFPGKRLVGAFLLAPMIVPIVIYSVGLYFYFAPWNLTATHLGLILAHAVLGAPFVLITVGATLSGFDRTLIRAGQSLGATPIQVARHVVFPLIAPGVVFGGLFAFAVSLEEVITVLLIGGPNQRTLPREMFSGIRENISPTIAAAATIMIVLAILLLVTAELLRRRSAKLRSG
ncbi:ABC transporter permease [Lutibaculum baratangense]|uniref:Spermidine Putrescine ABC transporter permease component potC n=1 Tax=Lutibaculum baratangense AMV1 TaxID=631454 RepID=V4RLY1_9HYPH|nr:ABC transporter permease [Lutibaculum baratangense]ESR27026.1 Spermidine Putrescine ABC transporter permease component potC [Lutibaculum baratangense AMV1]